METARFICGIEVQSKMICWEKRLSWLLASQISIATIFAQIRFTMLIIWNFHANEQQNSTCITQLVDEPHESEPCVIKVETLCFSMLVT